MYTQSRARIGGEIGVNGEFYEGGKFLPSTKKAKGKPRKSSGKQQIAPGVWDVAPDGYKALYGVFDIFIDWNIYRATSEIKLYAPAIAYYQTNESDILSHAQMWKLGCRWFKQDENGNTLYQ